MKRGGQDEGRGGRCLVTPRRLPLEPRRALAHLKTTESALSPVIAQVGPLLLPGKPATLLQFCRAIIGQQLSTRVADVIASRFTSAVGDDETCTPSSILRLSDEELRAVGLSRAKTSTVRALATHWEQRRLSAQNIAARDDQAIMEEMTAVKGIGPWTVQMILIFCLRRPDVLPSGDLGLRQALARLDGRGELPKPAEVERRAEAWRPWRTVATWYLWQSLRLPSLPR